jgi:hypothetical protein
LLALRSRMVARGFDEERYLQGAMATGGPRHEEATPSRPATYADLMRPWMAGAGERKL